MAKDEEDAVNVLTEAMNDEELDMLTRVQAAGAFLQWSTLESIAKHFDKSRG